MESPDQLQKQHRHMQLYLHTRVASHHELNKLACYLCSYDCPETFQRSLNERCMLRKIKKVDRSDCLSYEIDMSDCECSLTLLQSHYSNSMLYKVWSKQVQYHMYHR